MATLAEARAALAGHDGAGPPVALCVDTGDGEAAAFASLLRDSGASLVTLRSRHRTAPAPEGPMLVEPVRLEAAARGDS